MGSPVAANVGVERTGADGGCDRAFVLHALLTERHSCRGYKAQQVPRDTIAQILALAQRTPSWGNVQPWRVVITSGAATDRFRNALSAEVARRAAAPDFPFPREYRREYAKRRRDAAMQLFGSLGFSTRAQTRQLVVDNYRFYGAPHVAIVTTDEALGVYGAVDCGAYVTCFMLAASSLGVSSIAQGGIAGYAEFIRHYFQLPPDRQIVCGIAFGLEDPAHPANGFRTDRASVDELVTWCAD